MSEKKSSYNKWHSRRWIITVWAMAMITVICILGIIFKDNSYVTIATTLVAIPVAFTSLETLNKRHTNANSGNEQAGGKENDN